MTSPDQYAEAERRADDDRPGAPEDDKRRSRPDARAIVAIAVAVCALTATAFVLIHSQELISVLP